MIMRMCIVKSSKTTRQMDLVSLSLSIIVAFAALHLVAFFVIKSMYPPSPVAYVEPVIEKVVNVEPHKEVIPIETPNTERESTVIIPTIEDTPVQRDAGVDNPEPQQ